MAETEACKALWYGDLTWSEVLEIFVRRAQKITDDGVGVISAAWWGAAGASQAATH